MGQGVEHRPLYGVLYHRNDDDAVVLSRNRKSSGRLGSENRLAQPFGCKPRRRRPIVKEAPVIITHNGAEGLNCMARALRRTAGVVRTVQEDRSFSSLEDT